MGVKKSGASVSVWEMYNDWEGSRTKSESQLRGAHVQVASRKGEIHWNDSGNPGHKTQSKYKDLCDWTQEIRNHQFSISHTPSFPSLFFDGLSLTTFFLKASTPNEEVQDTCPKVLYPDGISNKERNTEDIRVQGFSLNDPPQITCIDLDQPSWQVHGILWLGLHGLVVLTQQHTWLSISSRNTWLKLGRGSPKESDWEIA